MACPTPPVTVCGMGSYVNVSTAPGNCEHSVYTGVGCTMSQRHLPQFVTQVGTQVAVGRGECKTRECVREQICEMRD